MAREPGCSSLFSQQAADNSSARCPPSTPSCFPPLLCLLPTSLVTYPIFLIFSPFFSQPASCSSPSISARCLPPSCLSPQLLYFNATVFPSLSDSLSSPTAAPPYPRCVNQLYSPAGTHCQWWTCSHRPVLSPGFLKWQTQKVKQFLTHRANFSYISLELEKEIMKQLMELNIFLCTCLGWRPMSKD